MTRKQYSIVAGLSFFVTALLAFNYIMSLFFASGTEFSHTGRFAYLSAYAHGFPMNNVPMDKFDWSFFSIHISPILYLTTFVFRVLDALAINLHDTVYFALLYGLWFGIMGLSVFLLSMDGNRKNKFFASMAFILAVAATFNGASLSTFTTPSIEVMVPAFGLLFFVLFLRGAFVYACISLFLGLLIREDVGLHYFTLLCVLTLCLYSIDKEKKQRRNIMKFAFLAFSCFLFSIVAISAQKILFPNAGFVRRLYFGEQVFAHIDEDFLRARVALYYYHRMYLWLPLLVTVVLAIIRRDLLLMVGVLASLPFLILTFFGVDGAAGTLEGIHCFPILLVIFWPFVSNLLRRDYGTKPINAMTWWLVPAVIVFSSLGTFRGSGYMMDFQIKHFGFQWYGKVNSSITGLDRFFTANKSKINYLADEAVSTVRNSEMRTQHWIFFRFWDLQEQVFPYDKFKTYDTVVYSKNFWQQLPHVNTLIHGLDLNYICHIENTNYIVASKHKILAECPPLINKRPEE